MPWTATAPTGSSMYFSSHSVANTTMMPASRPIASAPMGRTASHPAVMPTSPASTPLSVIVTLGMPSRNHVSAIAPSAPAPAARNVLAAMMAIPGPPAVVEPALKPNQPNHRMNTPSAASGML